jgi:hypothetical protein
MTTYTFYHIQGRKVGCTINFKQRQKQYPPDTSFEILDQLEFSSHEEAAQHELTLNKQFGYNNGRLYSTSRKANSRVVELGKTGLQHLSHDQRVEAGRKGGKQAVKLKTGIHSLTDSQRKKNSRNAGLNSRKRTGGEASRPGGLKGAFQKQDTCPHCRIISHIANLRRWHFDNCPRKLLHDKINARLQGR